MHDEQILRDVKAVKKEHTLEKHVQTILLSVITVAIIGGFNKITNISESLIRIEERDKMKTAQINTMQQSFDKMQADINELKERVSKFESSK